ncbi:MAG: dihydrodipicolinate synthase family protein [Lentisphaeria bacterium]|nr:dihydrodipicolinate synthase family protein [Lentisphaeria bacterium]
MSYLFPLKGLVAAAYTPMNKDESVALDVIGKLVEYSIEKKIAGLFAVGSTGEFCSLTMDERKAVAREYVKTAAGRIPIIVNVASCCQQDAVELAEAAVADGADAVCGLAPFYFCPDNNRALVDFLKPVAEAADGRPFFLYHAPGITGYTASVPEFVKIASGEIPNFAGVKYTNMNLFEYQQAVNVNPGVQILFGKDEMILGALAMGAEAGIGTTFNYLPKIYHGVIDNFRKGDMAEARRYMDLSQKAVAISGKYGLETIKVFMKFAGIDVGPMRSPVTHMTREQEYAFRKDLSEAGLDDYIG